MTAADPRLYKDPKQSFGMPEDDKATNTTDRWSMIALLKGILDSLTGGAVSGSTPDDTAFTVGTDLTTPIAGLYKASRDSVDDGDVGALAMTARRALYVVPESPFGDSLVDDTNDALKVVQSTASLLNVTEASAVAILAKLTTIAGATSASGVTTIATTVTDPLALAFADLQRAVDEAAMQATVDSDTLRNQLLMAQPANAAPAAVVTALASTASSQLLLPENPLRKGLMLTNTDANAVLVKYGATASSTSFTVRIAQNGYWEMPRPVYTGRIDAIWEADGSGSLYATEM